MGYEINELIWSLNSNYLLIATASSDSGNIDIIEFQADKAELLLVDTIAAHTSNCFTIKVDAPNYRRMAVGGILFYRLFDFILILFLNLLPKGGDYNVTLWDLENLVCHHTIPLE